MKRFLTLLLALSLCILVGCKEEIPEKPIEEISVEEIPVEKEDESTEETPTEKADEPIEEVPAEPEIEESTEEIGEDVIMLPEANENTKIITIEFPDDFPEEPYKEPEFVSPEEFEWGEYVPFVRYSNQEYRKYMDFHDYAILTSHCNTVAEGNAFYHSLNNKYLIESKVIDKKYCEENEKTVLNDSKYIDFLFKSRVIHISNEADEIGVLRFEHQNSSDSEFLAYQNWNGIYDVYSGNEKISSTITTNTTPSDTMNYIDTYSHNYIEIKDEYKNTFKECNVIYADDSICAFSTFQKNNVILLYSFEDNRITHKIEIPYLISNDSDIYESKLFNLEECINERYLLFDVSHTWFDNEGYSAFFATYIYDLEKNTLRLLEPFAFKPSLSPDLKYLAYTNNFAGNIGYDVSSFMKDGFYIKNLKNGNTAFFENKDGGYYGIINWVNEEKLMSLIKNK